MPKRKAAPKKKRATQKDPFEPLRELPAEENAMLADVLMQAVLDEEGVSSPAVDEALMKCALKIHEQASGIRTLATASIHQLLGGFYEEEEQDANAVRHYRAALQAYARDPEATVHFPLALENYQRILSRLGKREQSRSDTKRFKELAKKTKAKQKPKK